MEALDEQLIRLPIRKYNFVQYFEFEQQCFNSKPWIFEKVLF